MSKLLRLAPLLLVAACSEGPMPPNIVLVTVDTLRADHLGCYGYGRETSPHLDALAERSVRFERAYVQWPKTGPSIASMMTSTYGSTSGVMRVTGRVPVPEEYDTLAELLERRGYETLASVSNASLSPILDYDQGFDHYVLNFDPQRTWDHRAAKVLGSARELVERRNRERPYFLWIHLLDPHSPYTPGPMWYEPFTQDAQYLDDDAPPIPLAADMLDPDAEPCEPIGQIVGRTGLRGLDRLRDYVARYDGEIASMDQELGDFLGWMEAGGHLERTLIAFSADHGESLGDHGLYFEHGRYPYDACGRVPLIVHHPDAAPGVVTEPMALIDLAPTLVEVAGARPGRQFEGESRLARLLGGPAPEPPQPVYAQSGYQADYDTCVRLERWKLVRWGSDTMAKERLGEPYELYDLLADPHETENLASARPDVVARLRALLDPWTERSYAAIPPEVDTTDLPPELEHDLRALGYVDGR